MGQGLEQTSQKDLESLYNPHYTPLVEWPKDANGEVLRCCQSFGCRI